MKNILRNEKEFQELLTKFKKLSPMNQSNLINKISDLAKTEPDKELQNMLFSLRDFFVKIHAGESKNAEEKHSDFYEMLETSNAETVADLEALKEIE